MLEGVVDMMEVQVAVGIVAVVFVALQVTADACTTVAVVASSVGQVVLMLVLVQVLGSTLSAFAFDFDVD